MFKKKEATKQEKSGQKNVLSMESIPNNKENKASCSSVSFYPFFSLKLPALPPLSEYTRTDDR
jgi:hypothetical protein